MTKKTWEEFQQVGLLWWINRALHLFGWAIVLTYDDQTEQFIEAYPVRCGWRGFDEKTEEDNFQKLTEHVATNMPELLEEVRPSTT